MLSTREAAWIRANAWSVEHDFVVHALYLGEPLFLENLLCFFDGETLFICCRGWPRQGTDVDRSCRRILTSWPFHRPHRINCWGDRVPSCECFSDLGYVRVFEHAADPVNEEVVVDLDHRPSVEKLRRRYREVRQRTSTRDCRVTRRRGFSWQEISLLRAFVRALSSEFDSVDLSYFLTVPWFLASSGSEDTIRVELTERDGIRGFAFATIVGNRFGALHTVVWDRQLPGACDRLYSAVLAAFEQREILRVSLGLTLHESLRRYKMKWGARPIGSGFVQAVWHDRDDASLDLHAYHWPAGLARDCFSGVGLPDVRVGSSQSEEDRR